METRQRAVLWGVLKRLRAWEVMEGLAQVTYWGLDSVSSSARGTSCVSLSQIPSTPEPQVIELHFWKTLSIHTHHCVTK